MIYVKPPTGLMWHYADSVRAGTTYCGHAFAKGVDSIELELPGGAVCMQCSAAADARARRAEGAAALERMPPILAETPPAPVEPESLEPELDLVDVDDSPDDDDDIDEPIAARAPGRPRAMGAGTMVVPASKGTHMPRRIVEDAPVGISASSWRPW